MIWWNNGFGLIKIGLIILIVISCCTGIVLSQTYQFTCSVQNQTVSGSDFYFDLYIQNTHVSQSIYLGNCDLTLTFNAVNFSSAIALNTQLGATNSKLEMFYSADANIYTAGPANIIVFNLLPPSPTAANFSTRVEEIPPNQSVPGTYIATIKVSTISNYSGTMNLLWRGSTPYNTVVSTFQTYNYQTDITSSGSFVNPTNAPLPVELLSFSAYNQDDHVHLHWETATELNNFGFQVQRREEGAEWKTVGFVPGHGTRFYPQIYDWDDMLADLEIPISLQRSITYRLKQVDRDGSFEYSPMVDVAFRPASGSIVMDVYPNPAHDRAAVSVMLNELRTVDIVVYDINGRAVRRVVTGRPLQSGSHAFDIDAHNLPSGIYTIRILDKSGVVMKPFVVRK